ncbi:MAG TPA: I78 family peptidase inhibitor [Burkholderiaceae bacterium]|nr:I78 family peptidase inhibitor [Burkholderiaceae bacterium]
MKRLLLASLFALAACQSGPSGSQHASANAPSNTDDTCGSAKFSHLEGTSGENLNESMFPAGSRVLRPGMVMTMDYRGDRLNVVIDEAGKVDRVYCG